MEGWPFWCKEWPPSSPDLAPLDYTIWDAIASVACKDPAPNVDTTKARVNDAWQALNADFVRQVFHCQGPLLETCIAAGGGRIE